MNGYQIVSETIRSATKKYGTGVARKTYKKKMKARKLKRVQPKKLKSTGKKFSSKYGHLADDAFRAGRSNRSNSKSEE